MKMRRKHLSKRASIIFLTMCLLISLIPYGGSIVAAEEQQEESEGTQTYVIEPEIDVFVHSSDPDNTKKEYRLIIGAGREAYLRFDLSNIEGTITDAKLQMFKYGGPNINITVTKIDDDDWEESVTYNHHPELGDVLSTYSTSGSNGVFITTDMTRIIQDELMIDEKLSINLSAGGSGNDFYSTRGEGHTHANGDFEEGRQPLLFVTTMSDEAVVAADKAWIEEQFSAITVGGDIVLPLTGDLGSELTWTSYNEAVISNDGVVTRPDETSEDAIVTLTVTIRKGDVIESIDVLIHVPKIQPVSPFIQQSLQDVIDFAEATMTEVNVLIGHEPGAYPAVAVAQFEVDIATARAAVEDDEANHAYAVTQLIEAGNHLFNSVVTSDTVIDEENALLEYSEFRQELRQLVWEAKALLLVEPELYTEAAKIALNEQIAHAEAVLAGDYELPFVRNRGFVTPRPDEDIQFTIEYISRAPSYGMSTYGLKPAIQWYKSQYILNNAFATYELRPATDTYINSGSSGANFGTAEKAVMSYDRDNGIHNRIAFLKFDLTGVPGNIRLANLQVSNAKNDNNFVTAHFIEDDSWTEYGLTYNNAPKNEHDEIDLGPELVGWQLGGMNNRSTAQITDAVVRESLGDQLFSIAIVNSPSANYPSEIYLKEHADVTRQPVLSLTLDTLDTTKLQLMHQHVSSLATTLLAGAEVGGDVGQYPAEAIHSVSESLTNLQTRIEEGHTFNIGVAFVEVYDAMREMRMKQVVHHDVNAHTYLFFDDDELEEIKHKINTNPAFRAEFEELKSISDEMTLEEIESLSIILDPDVDFGTLNEQFKMWSFVNNQNFVAPANAAFANIRMTIPATENEAEGLGHVWIDNIRIYSATGGDLDIKNAGFELGTDAPEHWHPVTISGNPVMKWEDGQNLVARGQRSLYIENPTSADQGAWDYALDIPITPGDHTLTYDVKIDGFFKEGVNVIVSFKDEQGNSVDTPYKNVNNHKSAFGSLNFNLAFQADAFVYAVTGDIEYAKKAKERMMFFLNDHLQGIESWLVNNQRPFGYDAYGAVQTGRNAAVLASSYSLIKDANVFTAEEYDLFIRQVNYMIRNLLDIRDRTELGLYDAQRNTGNWETDQSIGAALLGMAFGDELAHARQWIDNGKQIVEGQLLYTLRHDGAWPESVRYHFAVLEKVGPFAKALRNTLGEDWFAGDSVLKKMFKFVVEVHTPPYEYFNHASSTPNFGDHVLGNGTEFNSLGQYFDEINATDPVLAAQVYQTWERGGKHFANYSGEAVAIANFFGSYDLDMKDYEMDLQSTDYAKDWGMMVFRNHFNTERETYMAIVANEQEIGHHHNDQGSFILYSNKIPLVMDPGIESYFDTSRRWYVSSNAHSVVQFKHNGAYVDTPRTSKQEEFYASPLMDYTRISINHPSGAAQGVQTRNVAYIKGGIDAFVIWDQIKNAQDTVRFNLPVAAISSVIDGNVVESTGHYHMDLQTTFLLATESDISQEFARTHAQVPAIDGVNQLNYIRAEAEPGKGFLTVLYPKTKGEEGLSHEPLAVDDAQIEAYRMTDADGHWFIVAVNDSDISKTVTLPVEEALIDLRQGSDTTLAMDLQGVSVELGGNGIGLFKPASQVEQPADPPTPPTSPVTPPISPEGPSEEELVEPEGLKQKVIADEKLLDTDDNEVMITLPEHSEDMSGVIAEVPADILQSLAESGKPLVIQSGDVVLTIPAAVIADAAASSPSNLSIHITLASDVRVPGGDGVSNVYDLTITTERDGQTTTISTFNEALTVQVPVADSDVQDPRKVAGYRINGNSLEYVGGKYEDGKLIFRTHSLSLYVAVEKDITFADIATHWAKDEIEVLASRTITNGKGLDRFAPEEQLTRAEFAVLIARALNLSVTAHEGIFQDVTTKLDWAHAEIESAYRAGIIHGRNATTFDPSANITREELATMVMRAIAYVDATLLDDLTEPPIFTDSAEISSFARDAAINAQALGIIQGKTGHVFDPKGTAKRAEAVTMLYRALEKLNEL